MHVISVTKEHNQTRRLFFETIFGSNEGFIGVAWAKMDKTFQEEYFYYPSQMDQLLEWINVNYHGKNLYFCPQLLVGPKRNKGSIKVCTCLWADLDKADPNVLKPAPSIVLNTSPTNWQGFWLLEEPIEPADAEEYSHRLAYRYKEYGVDQSGWDLSQLLRIPVTYNMKYQKPGSIPVVMVARQQAELRYTEEAFKSLPEVPGYEFTDIPLPKNLDKLDPDVILERHRLRLDSRVFILYHETPAEHYWSQALFNLEMLLLEANMSREETFVICLNSACNKFQRDDRPPIYLWRDICRASARFEARVKEVTGEGPRDLLTPEERAEAKKLETFVERYTAWAASRGDAAVQYHHAASIVALSTILAGVIRLPTSFGTVTPNIWVFFLGDTTLSRKTTAMDMIMDLLLVVDPDAVVATDVSIEGLLTGIASRPNRPSIFLRDEVSGFLDSIRKKDYLAGAVEALTKLYDGKYQKRLLRKEVIEIRDPILIFFCGGTRTRVLEILDVESILSGFVPRFIFVSAESNLDNYKPIGPMTDQQDRSRDVLIKELSDIKEKFTSEETMKLGDQVIVSKRTWEARLNQEAWNRYNKFEKDIVQFGLDSAAPEIFTPILDRLAKSALKVAVLLAAARAPSGDYVEVTTLDILKAISYAERWRDFSVDVGANVGKTVTEKRMDQILRTIQKHPNGISRSRIMQYFHLTARETDWLFETLDQRGLIRRVKPGRGEQVFPSGV